MMSRYSVTSMLTHVIDRVGSRKKHRVRAHGQLPGGRVDRAMTVVERELANIDTLTAIMFRG